MKLQRLLSLVRQAVDDYALIDDQDHIAVGVSGGKDSLALLYALHELQRFYPKHFTLHAFTVDLGFGIQDFSGIKAFCDGFQVPLTIIPTEIGKIVFETRKESNPCALCAKMRKGALNLEAKAAGCNKIAYAHHKDDIIETMLLSLMFEGRFYTFPPKTFLDRTELTVIRPLMYVSEADVIGFKNKYNLPVCKNPCPADGHTKREYVKNLTSQLNKENPGIKERLFHAVISGNIEGWNSGNIGMAGTCRNSEFCQSAVPLSSKLSAHGLHTHVRAKYNLTAVSLLDEAYNACHLHPIRNRRSPQCFQANITG